MSDSRSERDVLLSFIKDEVLAFTSKIQTMNKSLGESTDLMKSSIQISGSTLAAQVTLAMDELGRRVMGIQNVVEQGQSLLKEESEILKKQLEATADQSREGAKFVLRMGAYDLAREAVSHCMREQLLPQFASFHETTKQMVELTNKAIENLQNTSTQARKSLNQMSWMQVGVLASIVFTSTLVTNLGVRALDNNWPWRLTATEVVTLNNGRFMEKLWPTLDEGTQKQYQERVEKL